MLQLEIQLTTNATCGDTHFTLGLVLLFGKFLLLGKRPRPQPAPVLPATTHTVAPRSLLHSSVVLRQDVLWCIVQQPVPEYTLLRKAAPTALTFAASALPIISTMGQFSSCVALGKICRLGNWPRLEMEQQKLPINMSSFFAPL